MSRKNSLIKVTYSFLTILAGFAIIGGIYFSLRIPIAKATQEPDINPNLCRFTAKDNEPNNIFVECEGKDVTLIGGNFWDGRGTWLADKETVWQKDKTITENTPDGPANKNVKKGDGCDNSGDSDCDTKRHFKSLTLKNGAVLTHSAVEVGDSDIVRQRRKVDLVIDNNLTIENNSAINVDGKGYPGGQCLLYDRGECQQLHFNGYGPSGGTGIYLTEDARGGSAAGSGGSWGGTGGKGYCDGRDWACQVREQRAGDGLNDYTVVTQFAPYLPTAVDASSFTIDPVNNEEGMFQFGSGGGSGRSNLAQADGGFGGGRIRVNADKIIIVNNSRISANGANGADLRMDSSDHNAMGGGGSGGTIILNTPTLVSKWGNLNEEPITGALVSGGKSSHCEKWNWEPGVSWCENREPFSVGWPHYGQSGKVYTPQSINTFKHSNLIGAVGGYATSDPDRNNRATFAGGGGGGVVVLKGIAQAGHWNPPSRKKVTVTVGWSERTASKSTILSSIVYGKPVWISDDNTLVLKPVEVKNQNTSDFSSRPVLYTSRDIGEYNETDPYIGLWGGHRITAVDSEDASNYYQFIYRDVTGNTDRNFDNDIASDGTNFYISATSTGKIYKFNTKMEFISKIYIENNSRYYEEPTQGGSATFKQFPISITSSKGSQDIYVLVADHDNNNYKIYQCNKDFSGNCQQYQLDFVGPIDPDLKLNIAYADNAPTVANLSKLFLVASDMTFIGRSKYIARLKLGDNGNGSQILYDDGVSPYNGGSGIYVSDYGSGTGLTTVNVNFRCWWSGFNLSTADRSCDDTGLYGRSLDIAVNFSPWTSIFVTNSVDNWIQIPNSGSFYDGVGGGGVTYFKGKIAF